MKNKFKILYIFLGVILFFTACTPKENELGGLIEKSALKYSITQDATDPNMVILKSMTPGVTPQWITPQGHSTRVEDTLKIPFPGTYKFVYGVESDGGLVQSDTMTLNITTTNLSYVNDPLWTMICGGVGNEKTWLLDITADGVSKYFKSPKYFLGVEENWFTYHDHIATPKLSDDEIKAKYGLTKIWVYDPVWKETDWMKGEMPAADYGSMTFDLKGGGAHATVNHLTIPGLGTQHGTFLLDATNHTLKLSSAVILHPSVIESMAKNGWDNLKVLTLTDDYMQLHIARSDNDEAICLNFISKDYADKWVPSTVTYAEPLRTSFTKDSLVGTWKYNTVCQSWIGWEEKGSKKGGALLNNWPTRAAMLADLTSWGGNAATITATDDDLFIFNADGTCTLNGVNNTYTVSKGVITFGTPLVGTEWSVIYITLTGTKVGILNVTSRDNKPYKSTGIWLGQKNGDKNEDASVQLVKQ
jgi:hypothetical protein